ncbi:MAG: hypothetical protein U0Q16_10610 [Bryobacteraceae bacterium]
MKTVPEIQNAISALNQEELEQLYAWLDCYAPQPIDVRLRTDLAEGRLDRAISQALDDEANGRTLPL